MARAARNDDPGTWHHVMNRGIRRYPIFSNDEDRYRFVELVRHSAELVGISVSAICLMGNHFHLVTRCGSEAGSLSAFMQRLAGRYTRQFNQAHGLDGSLFRSRFRSVEVGSDEQLLVTTRYVHRNPLELAADMRAYPWSSYRAYLRGFHPWLELEPVLQLAGGPAGYARFVEEDVPTDAFSVTDGVRSVAAAPDERPSLRAVRRAVAEVGAAARAQDRRRVAVLLAVDTGAGTSSEIAASLGLTSAGAVRAVASRCRSALVEQPDLAELYRSAAFRLRASTNRPAA